LRRTLHNDIRKIQILKRCECEPSDTIIDFWDTTSALNFLCRFMREPFDMAILRSALAQAPSNISISRMSDHEVLELLSWQITKGYLKLVIEKEEVARDIFVGGGAADEPEEPVSPGTTPGGLSTPVAPPELPPEEPPEPVVRLVAYVKPKPFLGVNAEHTDESKKGNALKFSGRSVPSSKPSLGVNAKHRAQN